METGWAQILLTGGVSLLVLVAIGIALWRGVGPYAKKLIDGMLARMDKMQEDHRIERERLEKEHRAEREQMLSVLNALSQGFANTTNAIGASTAALNKLTDAVEERHATPRARQR